MMQKRTNPLELKVENPARIRQETVVAPITPPDTEEAVFETVFGPKQSTVAKAPIEQAPTEPTPTPAPKKPLITKRQQISPALEEQDDVADVQHTMPTETAVPRAAEREVEKMAPAMNGAVTWQMVAPQKAAPTASVRQSVQAKAEAPKSQAASFTYAASPMSRTPEPVPAVDIEDEDDILTENVETEPELQTPVTMAASAEPDLQEELEQDDDELVASDDAILDEQMPLVLEDYAMAARFSLRGRVSRGMKIGKISRDVCRLAQLMHPEQSLSAILEDALLTRIYLENRDAFDALAELLEKKGGHIKC